MEGYPPPSLIMNKCLNTRGSLELNTFCKFQGQIRYEMIGDYPSQSFFRLDGVTGIITTTASLRSDASYNTFYVVSLSQKIYGSSKQALK